MDSIVRLKNLLWQSVGGSSSSFSTQEKEITDILEDLEWVHRTSDWIKAVFVDAEEKAVRGEERVKQWLNDLQQLEYRAADLLGRYEYEVVAQQVNGEEASASTAAAKRKRKRNDQVEGSSPLMDPCFRQEFAGDIRKFRKDFDEINRLKEAFRFEEEDGEKINRRDSDMMERLPTGSEPVDDNFLGRGTNMQELIHLLTDDMLVENGPNNKGVPVIALVGMGGVGKTTLAQHAYKDEDVCNHYSKKGWVCVSDNFHVERLIKATLDDLHTDEEEVRNPQRRSKAATREMGSNYEEFSSLQTRLRKASRENNKFLLILDDVWNKDVERWDTFYSCLRDGAKGSRIVITTRSKVVAETVQAVETIDVGCLSKEDSWALFQKVVFGEHGSNKCELEYPALVGVGKKITERCNGLPLAIKVLGRYLGAGHNKDSSIWEDILRSDLWEDKQVFGPLTLSYLHLPPHLKRCFVLSAVFPKAERIYESELVDLWTAHELVKDTSTGMRCIQNLVARSFLQEDGYGVIKMHDLIHDLALLLSRDKISHERCTEENAIEWLSISKDVQHAFVKVSSSVDVQVCLHHYHTSSLRTFYLDRVDICPPHLPLVKNSASVPPVNSEPVKLRGLRVLRYQERHAEYDYFLHHCLRGLINLRSLNLDQRSLLRQDRFDAVCTLYNLRVLQIIGTGEDEDCLDVPDSIGNLRHLIDLQLDSVSRLPDSIGRLTDLCHLSLDYGEIMYLPDAISKLVNLKELGLSHQKITTLPESIGNLKSLEVLTLDFCRSLEELPPSIGDLKALKVLSLQNCFLLQQLPGNLLHLTNMTSLNVAYTDCYFPVGIGRLSQLERLALFRVPPRDLGVHEHVAGLKELGDLVGIRGHLWIRGLNNVVGQEDAKQSELLNKRHIRTLLLDWRNYRLYYLSSFYDDSDDCDSVNEDIEREDEARWSTNNTDDYDSDEPVAQDQQVLQGLRPNANLEELFIIGWRGRRLASWLGDRSFADLRKIYLSCSPNCKTLIPLHQLPALERLYCYKMPSLAYLAPPSFFRSGSDKGSNDFPALVKLTLRYCPSLVALADFLPRLWDLVLVNCDSLPSLRWFDSLPELGILTVRRCVSLTCIPFCKLPALRFLEVTDCPNLQFVDSTNIPSSLDEIHIINCPQLKSWCDAHRHSKEPIKDETESMSKSSTWFTEHLP